MYPHQSPNGEERVDWRAQQQRNNHTCHNSTGQFDSVDGHEAGFQTDPAAGGGMAASHPSTGGARRADLEYNNDDVLIYGEADVVGELLPSSNLSPPPNRYNNNNNNDGSSGGPSSHHASPNVRRTRLPRMSVPNLVASMSMGQPEIMLRRNSMDNDSHSQSNSSGRHLPLDQSQNSSDFMSAPYQDLMSEQQALEEQRQALQRASSRRAPKRTPMPKAGVPMEPIISVVEPTLPAAKLSKRGMPKPKGRRPDLQVGVTPKQPQTNNGGQQQVQLVYVIDCAGCGCQLQIEKGTILVQCHACRQVYPTAACRVHAS